MDLMNEIDNSILITCGVPSLGRIDKMDLMNEIDKLYLMFDLGEIDEQTLSDTLESMSAETVEQVERLACAVIRRRQAAEAVKTEIQRLQDRKMALENQQEKIKKIINDYMIKTDNRKITTALADVSIRKNPASVHIIDESKLDDCFFVIKKELSKSLIKDFLKNGGECAGAELVSGESLVIK